MRFVKAHLFNHIMDIGQNLISHNLSINVLTHKLVPVEVMVLVILDMKAFYVQTVSGFLKIGLNITQEAVAMHVVRVNH